MRVLKTAQTKTATVSHMMLLTVKAKPYTFPPSSLAECARARFAETNETITNGGVSALINPISSLPYLILDKNRLAQSLIICQALQKV